VLRRSFLQSIVKKDPHLAQTPAHLGQFHTPGGFEFRIVENRAHNNRAVIGRYRVDSPDYIVDLAVDNIARGIVGRQHGQGSDAVAIQAKILGTGIRHDHFRHATREVSNYECVVVKTGCKSLVRHVNERHKSPLDNDVGDRAPFILARIKPRGVVATGMQEDEIARRHLAKRVQHLIDQYRVTVGVVVRIRLKFQASTG
jgi:hypothetical protein